MDKDGERLKQLYENSKTEDLMKAVTVDKANYEPRTIDIINTELQKRNISDEDIVNFQGDYLKEEETLINSGRLYCPQCHSLAIHQERRIWHFLIFGLGLFLTAKYRCSKCGYYFGKSKENR